MDTETVTNPYQRVAYDTVCDTLFLDKSFAYTFKMWVTSFAPIPIEKQLSLAQQIVNKLEKNKCLTRGSIVGFVSAVHDKINPRWPQPKSKTNLYDSLTDDYVEPITREESPEFNPDYDALKKSMQWPRMVTLQDGREIPFDKWQVMRKHLYNETSPAPKLTKPVVKPIPSGKSIFDDLTDDDETPEIKITPNIPPKEKTVDLANMFSKPKSPDLANITNKPKSVDLAGLFKSPHIANMEAQQVQTKNSEIDKLAAKAKMRATIKNLFSKK